MTINTTTAGSARAAEPPHAAGDALPIQFTASGSEYFRIWIVNLLLTLLTLGLYRPWAKVRKLRYFYGNTWVGEHAFDFHGQPRRMLRGTLLVGLLFVAYSAASKFSPTAGLTALVLVAALTPALLQASLRFRLANTSWRGMRFAFNGSVAGAYWMLLPVLLPVAVFMGLALLTAPSTRPQGEQAAAAAVAWQGAAMGVTLLATVALVPFMFWRVKQYQHDHYALGRLNSQLRTGPKAFYGLFAKTFGVSVLVFAGTVACAVVAALLFGPKIRFDLRQAPFTSAGMVVFMALTVACGYLGVVIVSRSFLTSRLQNLLWSRTKSTEIRFESGLPLWPLLRLTLKNWALVLLTLGLYWPFAAVATARLRLEAVTVYTRRPVDLLSGRAGFSGDAKDASGDAAGDALGLDFGL